MKVNSLLDIANSLNKDKLYTFKEVLEVIQLTALCKDNEWYNILIQSKDETKGK